MSTARCCSCGCLLSDFRTTVRRADGTVRFEMCHTCFERRFCERCLKYFPDVEGRQAHQCPN